VFLRLPFWGGASVAVAVVVARCDDVDFILSRSLRQGVRRATDIVVTVGKDA